MTDVIQFPRLVPEPDVNARPETSIELAQLLTIVGQIEGEFVELTERLQREREHMVTLELPALVHNAGEKDALLRVIGARAVERRPVFERAWAWAGLDQQGLPETVPATLRALATAVAGRRDELRDAARRIEALMDSIEELQRANRGLVQRALAWVDGYLAELTGDASPIGYTATGRRRERSVPLLRRTV